MSVHSRESTADRPCAATYALPSLTFGCDARWPVPGEDACHALWDAYAMPEHIRAHSTLVAGIAVALADLAVAAGMGGVHPATVRASGLLHDIAKDYTIRHGGNHAQLGAAWALAATGNPAIAQGVMHHVHWPWGEDLGPWFLPLVIIYADKRVKHDRMVTLEERFDDLIDRYGRTERIRERIRESHHQATTIERALVARLGIRLHESTLDRGRLVERA